MKTSSVALEHQAAVLEALRLHPNGLTRPELAEVCEQDDLVISRTLASMRGDDQLSRVGLRGGHPIYLIKGASPVTAQVVVHVQGPAAKAVGGATIEGSSLPTTTVAARILDALDRHGPMEMSTIAKHVPGCDYISVSLSKLRVASKIVRMNDEFVRPVVYGLPRHKQGTDYVRPANKVQPTPDQADFHISTDGGLMLNKSYILSPHSFAKLRQFIFAQGETMWGKK